MDDPRKDSSPEPSPPPGPFEKQEGIDPLENPYLAPTYDSLTPAQRTGATGLFVGVFILVLVAVTIALPGLGILLAIVALPPFIRTLLVSAKRIQRHQTVSTLDRVLLFAGSFGVTLVVGIVVLISSIGTFCVVCLSSGDEKMIPVALLIAFLASAGVCVPLFYWIRYRWRRDTRIDESKEDLL
jgi:hypothetical protein